MKHSEQAALFRCGEDTLVGIVSVPETPQPTAVVVIVGGPQYRAGSHRQFVLLARRLAAAGYPVLRFDLRGMGDSGGEPRSFEHSSDDIAAAIEALQRSVPAVQQVVLWGLCDGASAALLYCHEMRDTRVVGLCLLNPWVRSQAGLARVQVRHYYTQRLREREFWIKLLSGRVAVSALAGMIGNVRLGWGRTAANRAAAGNRSPASFQQRMAAAWHDHAGSILLMLSGDDYTAKEFIEHVESDPAWRGALRRQRVELGELPSADHTCSQPQARCLAEDSTLGWLAASAARQAQ